MNFVNIVLQLFFCQSTKYQKILQYPFYAHTKFFIILFGSYVTNGAFVSFRNSAVLSHFNSRRTCLSIEIGGFVAFEK